MRETLIYVWALASGLSACKTGGDSALQATATKTAATDPAAEALEQASQLKLYRTYFSLGNIGASKNIFLVKVSDANNLVNGKPTESYCSFDADTKADLPNQQGLLVNCMSRENALSRYGASAVQDSLSHSKTPPPSLVSLASDIESFLRSYYHYNSKVTLTVGWAGKGRTVSLLETVPVIPKKIPPGPNGEAECFTAYALSTIMQLQLLDDLASSPFLSFSGGYERGNGGSICSPYYQRTKNQPVVWLDYQLPPSYEGSSIVANWKDDVGTYADERKKLLTALQSYREQPDAASPFAAIIKQQGPSVLPPNFNQYLTFYFGIYDTVKPSQFNPVGQGPSRGIAVTINVKKAFTAPVSFQKTESETGVKVSGSIDLKNNKIALQIEQSGNTPISTTLSLDLSKPFAQPTRPMPSGGLLHDGTQVAFSPITEWLPINGEPGLPKFTLALPQDGGETVKRIMMISRPSHSLSSKESL